MRMFANSILVMMVASLLLAMIAPGLAQIDLSEQAGMRPAEAAAKNLFDKGFGKPWVGGDPFASSTGIVNNQRYGATSPNSNYQIIGYVNVATGLIVASDSGSSLHFSPGTGNYPVYGYFRGNKMTGIFIDFNSSLV